MIDVKPSCAYRFTFFQTFSTEPQVVSTMTQPIRLNRCISAVVTPKAGRTTTSSGPSGSRVGIGVAQKLDALGAQPIVDVRVVDDLAGQEHAAVGKSLARLVGVVDRAIDAVAEAEFAREMNREAAGRILKVVGLDLLDEVAVVVLVQLGRDRVFQVEAFPEHERRGHWLPRGALRRCAS